MYLEYECAKRRLELQKAKFRDRCEGEIREQELAERRIDAKFQREETARQREQGVQDALARQQQAAKEQAANSPLTQLTWSRSAEFGSDVSQQPKAAQPQQKLTDRPRRKIAEVAAYRANLPSANSLTATSSARKAGPACRAGLPPPNKVHHVKSLPAEGTYRRRRPTLV